MARICGLFNALPNLHFWTPYSSMEGSLEFWNLWSLQALSVPQIKVFSIVYTAKNKFSPTSNSPRQIKLMTFLTPRPTDIRKIFCKSCNPKNDIESKRWLGKHSQVKLTFWIVVCFDLTKITTHYIDFIVQYWVQSVTMEFSLNDFRWIH